MGTLQHDPPVLPWTPQSHQQQAPHSADASTNPGSGGTWETDPGPTDVEASDSEPPEPGPAAASNNEDAGQSSTQEPPPGWERDEEDDPPQETPVKPGAGPSEEHGGEEDYEDGPETHALVMESLDPNANQEELAEMFRAHRAKRAKTNPQSEVARRHQAPQDQCEVQNMPGSGSEEHPIETDPTEEAAASSSNAEGKKPAFAKRLF